MDALLDLVDGCLARIERQERLLEAARERLKLCQERGLSLAGRVAADHVTRLAAAVAFSRNMLVELQEQKKPAKRKE